MLVLHFSQLNLFLFIKPMTQIHDYKSFDRQNVWFISFLIGSTGINQLFLIYLWNNWSECAFLDIVSYIGRKTFVAEHVISVQFEAFIFLVA